MDKIFIEGQAVCFGPNRTHGTYLRRDEGDGDRTLVISTPDGKEWHATPECVIDRDDPRHVVCQTP